MTQQLGWILEREGPAARIVVGAHNTHLQQHPVRDQKATSMGAYLANRIGRERILFIGAASARSVKGDEPRPDSNQAAYDRVGPECFFLDLRSAPDAGPVAHWLRTGRADRHNLRYQQIAPGRAWDCLLFNRTTSIAEVQLPPTMRRKLGPADPERFDDYVGDYVVHGFLAQPNALTVLREADALFADGSADLSGELFPPMKTRIQASDDGRFVWPNWPAVLEFHGAGRVDRVTITMPGMGVYSGHRVTPAEDA